MTIRLADVVILLSISSFESVYIWIIVVHGKTKSWKYGLTNMFNIFYGFLQTFSTLLPLPEWKKGFVNTSESIKASPTLDCFTHFSGEKQSKTGFS